MPRCDFDPENPESHIKRIRSKSIRALMASGLSPQAIVQILCEDGSDDARLNECPGFMIYTKKGKIQNMLPKQLPS